MFESLSRNAALLRRTDILITIMFAGLYCVWIAWPTYGLLPFFAFTLLIVSGVSKSQKKYRTFTDKMKEDSPGQLSEMYWTLLRRHGVAIFTPAAAASLATAFTRCKFLGYVVCAILAVLQRWVEVAACFSATQLAVHMERLLDPEKHFTKLSKKKPEYAQMAEGIRELKKWVQGESS